ncbi:RNA polymerase sigma factor SigX [Neptunitalea sp. Y10]|uniref:RNA polymerase sigma factor SigX n=2 Tax=Neptunitalea lumnitzerae TaxID=2965509 RepID=A0ABQ5MGB5_9FLAO|nr:RNA polymerase sigma factor SigX [Neptunitalea sp. Y10]
MSGDKDLSEDIVQEVFFKILKHRATFGEGKFIAWMFTIARNSLSGHYKKEQRFTTTKETIVAEVVEDPECKEQYSDLHAALAKLTPTDREVVVLNRLQGIRYEELAIILNSTPNAVKTKVSRALDKLRKVYFKQVEV